MSALLLDAGDRWQVGLKGAVVDQCCFGHAIELRLLEGSSVWVLQLEQPFVISAADGAEHLVVPEEADHLDRVLKVLRSTVEDVAAFKDGHFELRLRDGTALQVPPDEGFEAWTLSGPGGVRLVCLPGGGLAVWSA